MSGVLICIVPTAASASVYTIRPHRCTEGDTRRTPPQAPGKGKEAVATLKKKNVLE